MPRDETPSTSSAANNAFHESTKHTLAAPPMVAATSSHKPAVEWDWDVEHADRKREAKAGASVHGAQPFLIDRKLLKDVVREKLDCEVGRITFLSSGT